ncbi:hypothetical protein JTE90_007407 [Oedothorax gibbosus]|uniref:Uncharacterized protein n=1 Tax=Oedothorax gibbosus TaxID=931172 RepID=A0AAV6UIP8_9ARAC|nr:hypothetical protein JTE90_007407 [Oedothorax gibbosus]
MNTINRQDPGPPNGLDGLTGPWYNAPGTHAKAHARVGPRRFDLIRRGVLKGVLKESWLLFLVGGLFYGRLGGRVTGHFPWNESVCCFFAMELFRWLRIWSRGLIGTRLICIVISEGASVPMTKDGRHRANPASHLSLGALTSTLPVPWGPVMMDGWAPSSRDRAPPHSSQEAIFFALIPFYVILAHVLVRE